MRKKPKKIELKLEMYSYFVDDRRGDKKKRARRMCHQTRNQN